MSNHSNSTMQKRSLLIVFSLLFLFPSLVFGELKFRRHFSDHGVLQRNQPISLRGFSEKGSFFVLH